MIGSGVFSLWWAISTRTIATQNYMFVHYYPPLHYYPPVMKRKNFITDSCAKSRVPSNHWEYWYRLDLGFVSAVPLCSLLYTNMHAVAQGVYKKSRTTCNHCPDTLFTAAISSGVFIYNSKHCYSRAWAAWCTVSYWREYSISRSDLRCLAYNYYEKCIAVLFI